jgi:hypothetical protein
MSRQTESETEAVNADSFLDIVASIVSIMIIMVLMTGLKIKNGPVTAAMIAEASKGIASTDLGPALATEQSLRGDVLKLASDLEELKQVTAFRQQQRDMLAVASVALEQQTQATEHEVASRSQDETAVGRELAEARVRLEDLNAARTTIENAPPPAESIESLPTPIGRTVDDREIHFQLHGGRLTFVPFDSLLQDFQADAHRKMYKLRDTTEITETIGPEGGFRLRYTLERVEAAEGRGASVRLRRLILIPESDDRGETVDEALKDGSEFRRVLADRRSRGATVTIWTYPDSFDAFRRLRRELYQLEFPVACRPLPEGMPITASPSGTKSAAE